ncbi:MAG TPA: hypothetical protein VJM32_02100 [Candidatus Saccharimonadales bacterium]|nr:hypothetical protein [Candidatus Saccharimonadales bacterium]
MNDHRFDAKIVAASDRRSDDTNTFVTATMQKIKVVHAVQNFNNEPQQRAAWNVFARFTHGHKLAAGIIAAVIVSTVAFSGYAYAIGSDPISLVRRIIEGDKVKIDYDGRKFEHGTARSYSDAAISAYAEVNTVTGLAFRARNDMEVPKDGIEYVSLPPREDPSNAYQQPYFAVVTAIDANQVTLHKQYTWGDKMQPSRDINETLAVKASDFRYFSKGEPAGATASTVGTLVMVFPETNMRHEIASNKVSKATTYFGFAMSHELAAFKEGSLNAPLQDDPKQQVIFEPKWGGLSDRCLNNGADTCDLNKFSKQENEGLFVAQKGQIRGMNSYNPAAGAFFNVESGDDSDIIRRNIMGEISAIDDSSITVKTSSGALWKLMYTKADREAFDKNYERDLKLGDKLAGQMLQSVNDLNSRTIQHQTIASLERYQ